MTDPAVPSPSALIAPAIDALVAQRPNALQWINGGTGRYSHVIAGWRAQAALHVKRWAREMAASRLDLCSGDELRELCASEFETRIDQSPATAEGYVALQRIGLSLPQGVIARGALWVRNADPTAKPVPVAASQYETVTSCAYSSWSSNSIPQSVIVQVRATRPGVHANVVHKTGGVDTSIQPASPLPDALAGFTGSAALSVANCWAGGGSTGIDDALLRKIAKVNYTGQFGPNRNAVIAGAYTTRGVAHVGYFDSVINPNTGLQTPTAVCYVADESWGMSQTFAARVTQQLHDSNRVGFGCRVVAATVSNTFIAASCQVSLKKSQHLWDVRDVENNIKKACKAFFDQRPDWYTFRLSSLRAAIARADPKISTCSSASVNDYFTGSPISEPPATGSTGNLSELIHYYLPDEAVSVTYAPPT